MSKTLRGGSDAAPFFGPRNEHPKSVGCSGNSASRLRKVARGNASRKAKRHTDDRFLDGIVDGERVLVWKPKPELEKGIEIRIRVALNAEGVMVMKHHVDNRAARTGLGLGVADLICIVPPFGRFLAIEVKRPGYSPSDVREVQKRWLPLVRRHGGVAGIATSVEEALALLEEARCR